MEDNNAQNDPPILPNIASDVEPQYIISLTKFVILGIFSFGWYPIWWSYKAWRFFNQKDKLKINPALITGILFLYPLFKYITYFANTKGIKANYLASLLCLCYILSAFLARFAEEFWFLSFFDFLFFIPAFLALNQAKQYSKEFVVEKQLGFSKGQKFILVIGSLCLLMIIMSLF